MALRKVDPNDPMPRYYQVYTFLLDRIQSGEYAPDSAIPTERELGEEYGVSRITVIKSLDMLERDGYVIRQQGRGTFVTDAPNRAASTDDQITAPTLGLVSFALDDAFISGILVGLVGIAARHGHPMHIFGSVNSNQDEANAINDAIRRGVGGLIVNPWREYRNAPLFSDLNARGFPFVMVDRYYTEILTDYVIYENDQAGYDVTSALISQGHTRIAFIPSHEQRITSLRERLNGYRRALKEHGLVYDENLIWSDLPSTFNSSGSGLFRTQATDDLLHHHLKTDKPTGLLAANVDVAETLIDILCSDPPCTGRKAHLISGLAIGTFNHKEMSPGTPLVSVLGLHSGDTLGATAAEILVGRINGRLPSEPQRLHLPMPILQLTPNQTSSIPGSEESPDNQSAHSQVENHATSVLPRSKRDKKSG
ncbi:MAG: GntR family transcriptional regulator [Chloroflexi bacterium]|nr:GntR family transcriptional regulator [Chloroflexota bacterium]